MSHYKRLIILFFLLVICFSDSFCAINLPNIDKSKIRLIIKPGDTKYGEITLENSTSESRSIRAYLEDWYYLPAADGSKEFVPANTTSLSCASWISFSPSEFTLPPFSKQKLNYSVKVPANVQGGHYATLFFESIYGKIEGGKEGLGAGMDLAIRIATLFFIEAEGTVKTEGIIDNLSLKRENTSGPLLIQLDFLNSGNVDITAAGSFHIMDKKGMVISRGAFNDIYTFPGNKARLSASWKEALAKGKYDLILTLNLGKALEESDSKKKRGPVITKEAEIEIGETGQVIGVGKLK